MVASAVKETGLLWRLCSWWGMVLCEVACGVVEPLLYLDYTSCSTSQSSCWGSASCELCWYGGYVGVVIGGPARVPCRLLEAGWDRT